MMGLYRVPKRYKIFVWGIVSFLTIHKITSIQVVDV